MYLPRRSSNVKSNRIILSGNSGSYASTPDSSSLDITGDIEIIVCLSADDITPSVASAIVSKWTASGNQRSFTFYLQSDGTLSVGLSSNGSASTADVDSSVAVSASSGDVFWARVTIDVDNGSADSDFTFYTSTDPSSIKPENVSWTQLGAVVNSGSTESIFSGSAVLELGSINAGTATLTAGKIYKAQVYDGIGGTLVADFDLLRDTTGRSNKTFKSKLTGEIWTINGDAYLK